MNIVTVMNYADADVRSLLMCRIWLASVQRCAPGASITVLTTRPLPAALREPIAGFANVRVVTGGYDPAVRAPRTPLAMHNIFFKMYQLSRIREPFLYLDADIIVLDSLAPLWQCRHDKPWIAVDHQRNIPGHTGSRTFLNSGVQLVGDPGFYAYESILACAREQRFRFQVPGTDQACLWTYFQSIGYDYTHPAAGPEWNACAGTVAVSRGADGRWRGRIEGMEADVRINHYWGPFKPWRIGCPMYQEALATLA
jgi:hypothetical protein